MRRVFGDKKRIDLGSSQFARFIEEGVLYVDKTRFIEHVLDDASDVLLFTRPRRTGKSLNLDCYEPSSTASRIPVRCLKAYLWSQAPYLRS